MDIKSKIEEIISKIKDNKEFASEFENDPIKAVESVIGIDIPDDQVNNLIQGVKSKLAIDNVGDIFGSIKKLF
ncbi:MAG: hypothetical protein ACYDEX_11055 [Mobilitalea sp.]